MADNPSSITEKYVELSHGKTRYLEAGTGYPTILIHGVGFAVGAERKLANLDLDPRRLRFLLRDAEAGDLGLAIDGLGHE